MALKENRIIRSFNHVKSDVTDIKTSLEILRHTQDTILNKINSLGKRPKARKKAKKPKKTRHAKAKHHKKQIKQVPAHKQKRTKYVAQRGGKKFHKKNCPFAQNIKPKNKIVFKSRTKALNKGFKPCTCVK